MTWIGLISSARVATGCILRGPGAGLAGGVVGSWAALRSARTPGASTPGTRTTHHQHQHHHHRRRLEPKTTLKDRERALLRRREL